MFKSFQFCYCNVNLNYVAYRHAIIYNYTENNIKTLTNMLAIPENEAKKFMKSKSFAKTDTEDLKESIEFCKSIGLENNDFFEYPTLLTSHPLIKINHYNSLKDTGCHPIDAWLLSRATTYFRSTITRFKNDCYLDDNVNVAEQLLSTLTPSIKKPEVLKKGLKLLDNMLWSEIHKTILFSWLKVRLKATEDEIIKLLRIHQMIKHKSFITINENIELAESLGLSREKILKSGYLLHNHPVYPKTMLKESPFFAGVNFAKQYKTNPKLMMVSPRKIKEIHKVLKAHNIPDEMIQKVPAIFTMSPHTLTFRIQQIKNVPDLNVLFNDPHMLLMVLHHTRVSNMLHFLKKLNLKCASLKYLRQFDDAKFEEFLQEGKDVNGSHDVLNFFSRLLNKKKKDIMRQLRDHPYHLHVSFVEIDDTFKYLSDMGYTKESMAKCMPILLYSRDKIKLVISHLKNREIFQNVSQTKQLHLILYHIEKKFHFTGNGIWRTDLTMFDERTLE
ncbi:hypothetical protein ABEB36_003634 [Hypothenemus hampei]|uniref:Uncharacterized protein n=1 Tax=Hypothenemus hampei TaxID=57062 RepID=A0ABD1FAJ6_HYPHA